MAQYDRIADVTLILETLPERHGLVDFEPGKSRVQGFYIVCSKV